MDLYLDIHLHIHMYLNIRNSKAVSNSPVSLCHLLSALLLSPTYHPGKDELLPPRLDRNTWRPSSLHGRAVRVTAAWAGGGLGTPREHQLACSQSLLWAVGGPATRLSWSGKISRRETLGVFTSLWAKRELPPPARWKVRGPCGMPQEGTWAHGCSSFPVNSPTITYAHFLLYLINSVCTQLRIRASVLKCVFLFLRYISICFSYKLQQEMVLGNAGNPRFKIHHEINEFGN